MSFSLRDSIAKSKSTQVDMANPVVEVAVAPENYLKLTAEQQRIADETCELARELNQLWRDSYNHRNDIGVTTSMYEASYARQNKYSPCRWNNVPNKDVTIYAGVFSSIRMSAISHMRNMIKTSLQKPFSMEIDAIPEPAPYI